MAEKIEKPVAVCSVCRAFSKNAININDRCNNTYDGDRCNGVWRSAFQVGDWKECPFCNATGEKANSRCTQCEGSGWINFRK